MTRYFMDEKGNYIGGFDGEFVEVPDAIEISSPPNDARQKWGGDDWLPMSPTDFSALDTATLNAMLVEPGSVMRAMATVMFQEINRLRVRPANSPALPAYTMAQFVAALKANIR